jgi:hypothetical protein
MNDRIAEILNQPAFDRLKDWHDIGPVQKATLELFAELIVKEIESYIQEAEGDIDLVRFLIDRYLK